MKKGSKATKELRLKLRLAHLGYKHSESTKKKMSRIAKSHGFGKWMQGRKNHHSSKTKKFRSEKWLGKNNPRWKGGVTRPESAKKWRSKNRDRVNYHSRLRKARRKGAGGKYTLEEWENLKAQYNWTCPCCRKSEPEIKLTVDHIKPISKGGSTNIENIQPLCEKCNNIKGTKTKFYEI